MFGSMEDPISEDEWEELVSQFTYETRIVIGAWDMVLSLGSSMEADKFRRLIREICREKDKQHDGKHLQ